MKILPSLAMAFAVVRPPLPRNPVGATWFILDSVNLGKGPSEREDRAQVTFRFTDAAGNSLKKTQSGRGC